MNKHIIKALKSAKPLVSIVTPVFNGKPYLEETIQSVIGQTYDNIEYIIIDGGSTDGSLEIIQKYEDKIDYWRSELDSGMYEAINKGLKMASGSILAYINSDDTYYLDTVKRVVEYFQRNSDAELIFSDCDFINERGEFLYTYCYPKFRWKFFISSNVSSIPQATTFWRSTIHKEVDYFDTIFKMCADFDFYAKVGRGHHIAHINRPLARFRVHNASLTALQGYRNIDEVKIIHERYINFSRMQQKILSCCIALQLKFLNLSLMAKKAFYWLRKKGGLYETHN